MHYLKRGAAPRLFAPPACRTRPPLAPLPGAGAGAGSLPADADSRSRSRSRSSQTWSGRKYILQSPRRSEAAPMLLTLSVLLFWFQYLSQMKKTARDMMSGLKLGPGSSHGHFEVYHDANPIRECDGKVYEGVGLEVALISLPGQIHQGRQKGS